MFGGTPGYETRLIRVGSKDRMDITMSNTDFIAGLGNQGRSLAGKIVGVSVESVMFTNMIPNVSANHTQMQIELFWGADPGELLTKTITIAAGQYNTTGFAHALEVGFNTALTNNVHKVIEFSDPAPDPSGDGTFYGLEMKFVDPDNFGYWEPVGGAQSYIAFPPTSRRLPQIMGIPRNESQGRAVYYAKDPDNTTFLNYFFTPNLNGDQCVYLHSNRLTAGRVGAEGRPGPDTPSSDFSCICTCPITVPFGFLQARFESGGDVVPTVAWPRSTQLDFSQLDFSLRDHHGEVVDIGTAEMNITLRAFIPNRV